MKSKWMTVMLSLALVVGLFAVLPAPKARAGVTYYSTGSGVPNLTANWKTNRDGTGTSPTNFTSGDTFVIQNGHDMDTSATWTVSGTGAKIQVESGGTLTASYAVSVPTFQIDNGGKCIHKTGAAVVPGTTRSFAANSTYEIQNQGTSAISSGITWGNVVINLQTDPNQAIGNAAAFANVQGNFTVQNTKNREYRFASTQTDAHNIAGNLDIQGGTLKFKSDSNAMTVTIGGSVSVSSGATLIDTSSGAVTTSVAGNWSNNGTFTAGTGTVTFNKSGTAAYGGSSTTTFNNVIVNAGTTLDVGTNALFNANGTVTNNGTLRQTKTVNNATVDFLNIKNNAGTTDKYFGVQIATTNNLGSTTVSVSGNQICSQAQGYPVKRCFDVAPTTSASANIKFYYQQTEMQTGQTYNSLNVWNYHSSTWHAVTRGGDSGSCNSGAIDCYVQGNGISTYSPFALKNNSPTAVTLAEFSAQQVADHVRVAWETVSELDNRGFNLYRGVSPDGWDRQLNATLIPSQSQGNPGGFVYTYEDRADLVSGTTYYYWLEDVAISGATTMHGPVSVDYSAPTAVTLSGVSANPAAALPALSWLWVVVGAGVALALGRRR